MVGFGRRNTHRRSSCRYGGGKRQSRIPIQCNRGGQNCAYRFGRRACASEDDRTVEPTKRRDLQIVSCTLWGLHRRGGGTAVRCTDREISPGTRQRYRLRASRRVVGDDQGCIAVSDGGGRKDNSDRATRSDSQIRRACRAGVVLAKVAAVCAIEGDCGNRQRGVTCVREGNDLRRARCAKKFTRKCKSCRNETSAWSDRHSCAAQTDDLR